MTTRLSEMAGASLVGTSLAALAVALLVVRWSLSSPDWTGVVVVMALGALAHAYPVRGFRHQAYQVTLPFIILAAAMFSAVELIAFIAVIHIAEQVRVRRRLYIQWFNASDYLASAAVAGIIYHRAALLL